MENIEETPVEYPPKPVERKLILGYWVTHTESQLSFFKWDWSTLWIIVKYKVIWGMDVSMTVTKGSDEERYFVRFYAE